MTRPFPDKLFVTGTDTSVGKTVVSTILVTGLNASYWKPIQSGMHDQTDSQFVRKFSETTGDVFPESYCLSQPLSPHASAAHDGVVIDIDRIALPHCQGSLIVEGAGGVFVPLNDKHLVIDLIKKFGLPVLVVAENRLGAINQTLLTINALRGIGCELFGVVMNGKPDLVNREAIVHHGRVEVLAEIDRLETIDRHSIRKACSCFGL
nr:dethiobiotin synthase [Desulfobulbaceae bacterium]